MSARANRVTSDTSIRRLRNLTAVALLASCSIAGFSMGFPVLHLTFMFSSVTIACGTMTWCCLDALNRGHFIEPSVRWQMVATAPISMVGYYVTTRRWRSIPWLLLCVVMILGAVGLGSELGRVMYEESSRIDSTYV